MCLALNEIWNKIANTKLPGQSAGRPCSLASHNSLVLISAPTCQYRFRPSQDM
jgi:hypothetical protein